jgi:hypothetical protein
MPTVVTKRMRRKKNGSGWWREDQKIEAVAKYLILGNMTMVAKETGIARETLYKWKQTDWWTDTENEIRKQSSQELQGKLGKLIEKGIKAVEDRLDKGDYVYDPKSGSIKRIGVKASVANQITKDSIDRKILLEKISTRGTSSEEAVAERLASLRTEFLKFVNSKQVEAIKHEETTYAQLPELQTELPAGEQVQVSASPDQSAS